MIFPVDNAAEQAVISELPIYRDWAYDFEKNRFRLKGGRQYTVEGAEALKIWIWKALQTPRAEYAAYSHDYGQEFALQRGENNTDALNERLAKCITEALLVNPYITSVSNFEFHHALDTATIACLVQTVYGEIQEEVEVMLD